MSDGPRTIYEAHAACAQIVALTAERDAARDRCVKHIIERNALQVRLDAITSDAAVQAALHAYNAIPSTPSDVTAGKMIRDMRRALHAALKSVEH